MHLDIGTGDGTFVFRQAQKNPDTFFIGLDSNAENLRERSQKAARPAKKGGLPNLLYVHASLESLPEELEGLISSITILLPWGSLLQAAVGQEISLLKNIAKLCCKQASLRVVFGYDPTNEQKTMTDLGLPLLTSEYLDNTLIHAYEKAGFKTSWSYLSKENLKKLDTTWAKKLAYGKERQFIEIRGIFIASKM